METDLLFALTFVLVPLFIVAVLIAAIILLSVVFAKAGGWAKLAERYRAERQPEGKRLTFQTLMVGDPVRYRWCVTVVIAGQGLYLSLISRVIAQHPPILIPWSEIKAVQRARLYWWRAARLAIGDPPVSSITMWMGLFEAIRPHLPPGVAKDM